MKKVFAALSAILMVYMFVGCGGSDNNATGPVGENGQYQGFPAMKGGEWAEYDISGEGRMRYEYLGKDAWNNQECYVIELEMEAGVGKSISQIWIDTQNNNPVLYVMKQSNIVIKLEPTSLPKFFTNVTEGASDETPTEYQPGSETSFETYETPTGKQVHAAVFKRDSNEIWVSGDVPFGMVQDIVGGKTELQLYDFAFSGAVMDISKEEIENAVGFGNLPGLPDLQ